MRLEGPRVSAKFAAVISALTIVAVLVCNAHAATRTPTSTPRRTPTPTTRRIPTPTPTRTPGFSFEQVFIVLEENHGYSDVVGNTAEMPYLNSLIGKYGLAAKYFADTHPSLPNYLWLTTGSADGISSDDCGLTVTNPNIVTELIRAGVSWKAYQEDLPAIGYMGCDTGEYAERHDPFAYFSNVQDNSILQRNIVPFSEFASDLAKGTLPRYSFITPNLLHDAHDGTLAQADAWLKNNMRPLLASRVFQPGRSGLLLIVFDEGNDNTYGGGQVPWIAIGPKVRPRYRSTRFYQHQSTLRLILKGLGVHIMPGTAATAPDMWEFFQ